MPPTLQPEKLALLNDLRDHVAKNAEVKGFIDGMKEGLTEAQWNGPVGEKIRAAIYTVNEHGEVSEFWEAYRHGTLNKLCDKADQMVALGLPPLTCAEEEIADSLIRALDRAHAFGIDVAKAVAIKANFNATRPHLHGGKQA